MGRRIYEAVRAQCGHVRRVGGMGAGGGFVSSARLGGAFEGEVVGVRRTEVREWRRRWWLWFVDIVSCAGLVVVC